MSTASRIVAGILAAAGLAGAACEPGTPSNGGAVVGPTPEETGATRPRDRGAGFDATRVRAGLEPVTGGLEAPLLVTHAGDGTGRLFVVEQAGRIRILRGDRVEPEPFLDITERVVAGGEQGLLGLAFHPDYRDNGRLFVNYTDRNGDTVIAEYRRSRADADRVDPASARTLLQIDQPFPNHNGGGMAFGPDRYLYIGTGDGGGAGDPHENGQDLGTLLGKLLRIDVDRRSGDAPYSIPKENPFVGRSGARPEIWAYGLRNPWRFSFDPQEERLWIADVGQNRFEEIHGEPARRAGVNYGWDVVEGDACFEPPTGCERVGVPPVTVYSHDHGCSVTGGFVYRGSRHPALAGGYFFSDYCSGTIWAIDGEGRGRQQAAVLLTTERTISSFGVDEDGELYVTDHGSGEVLRLSGSRG